MIPKVIKNESQYRKAVNRTIEIFHAPTNSAEASELEVWLVLISDYEHKPEILPEIDPIEYIKLKMEETSMKSKDMIPLIGSKGHVSSVLSGRRELTLNMAKKIKEYFNLPAEIFFR